MTLLRSKKEVSFVTRRSTRRRAPQAPAKPRHQTKLTSSTRKAKPKADNTGEQSRTRTSTTDLTALTRNIRYRQGVRANELATGDNADTLREKRRWVQNEFDAGRLDGKATRELHDLYAKRNIGKMQHQQTLAQNLTDAAKVAKQRLEELFKQDADARSASCAVAQPLSDIPRDAALGDPSDSEAIHEATGDDAAGQAVGEDTVSEEDSETDDESSTEADDPAYPVADNDAVARQRVLALGLQLADYRALDRGTGTHMDDREGEDEVEVKMEGEDE